MIDHVALAEAVAILKRLEADVGDAAERLTEIDDSIGALWRVVERVSRARNDFESPLTDPPFPNAAA